MKIFPEFGYTGFIFLTIIALLCVFLVPVRANAADSEGNVKNNGLVSPRLALVSPHGGRLEAVEEKLIDKISGIDQLDFIVPHDSSNLHLSVEGRTIIRWSSSPVMLSPASSHSTRREQVENHKMEVAARLETVKARVDVWKMQIPSAGAQDLGHRQNLMEQAMPALVKEQEQLQRQLQLLQQELAEMPASGGLGKKITVSLAPARKDERKAVVRYSYDVTSCGWNAIYDFNARPGKDKDDMVDVRLLAEVWQYTGIDWTGTEIVLATRDNGPREPEPLPKWIVGQQPAPKPQPRIMTMKAVARTAETAAGQADMGNVAPPSMAHVAADTESVYASWTLETKGMPEGRSRLQITADAWKAPLQWLARPVSGDSRVWLLAKYDLPANQAWPAGSAQYSLDNQSVGEGYFSPRGGEATLYFGADPRVQVRTTIDSSKQGETGIINTNKTWSWAWTYTLYNEHNMPIQVRVERPEPMITNEDISVTYNDKPESKKDSKEHMVYWLMDVPAHGKSVIQHGVTITAPVKLPLQPDVP